MGQKDVGMANSPYPDQTRSTMFAHTCLSKNLRSLWYDTMFYQLFGTFELLVTNGGDFDWLWKGMTEHWQLVACTYKT